MTTPKGYHPTALDEQPCIGCGSPHGALCIFLDEFPETALAPLPLCRLCTARYARLPGYRARRRFLQKLYQRAKR